MNLRSIFFFMMFISSLAQAETAPILALVPDSTQVLLPMTGTSTVNYTVTNATAAANLVGLTIDPTQGGGFPSHVTLNDDTCTGSTLVPAASCTFTLLLSGEGLKEGFSLSPRVCGNNNTACSQPDASNRTVVTLGNPPVHNVTAYIATDNNIVIPVDDATLLPETPITGFNFSLFFVTPGVSADGNTLYVPNSGNNTLDIIDLTGVNPVVSVSVPGPVVVAVQPNSHYVYISSFINGSSGPGAVYVLDTQTMVLSPSLPGSFTFVYAITFSSDGTHAYLADLTNGSGVNFYYYDTSTFTQMASLPGLPGFFPLLPFASAAPDNSFVAISIPVGNVLGITTLDFSGGDEITLATDCAPTTILFSPDSKRIYVSCFDYSDGGLLVYDLDSATDLANIPELGFSLGLSLDPSGNNLYYMPLVLNKDKSRIDFKDLKVINTQDFSVTDIPLPGNILNIGNNPIVR